MFNFLKVINAVFVSKKPEPTYPSHFAWYFVNDIARYKGVYTEENMIVQEIKNGEIIYEYPFSKSVLESLKKQDIPVINRDDFGDEDFEFDTMTETGYTKLITRKQ